MKKLTLLVSVGITMAGAILIHQQQHQVATRHVRHGEAMTTSYRHHPVRSLVVAGTLPSDWQIQPSPTTPQLPINNLAQLAV
ncbi:hypothetical protein RA086_01050 [Lactiplantibacillus sp. WILCCON 0030]|uniref:Uncharacterized protein n=1 Tax=Lactiplantibacillus brownii TaxID=3069269 RepID=A0ABU1A5I0_9LACO|nr:hypothetical protein [Lactiplantibacillus brownii]MDQ7936237.1 hypothetical protein [Lactiplantibacillus brownii]